MILLLKNLEKLNPLTYKGWDNLLFTNKDYSFFFTTAWIRVLKETYGYSPCFFSIIKNGKIYALVPIMEVRDLLRRRKGVSLPFSDFCVPLLNDEISFYDILKEINIYSQEKKWSSVSFRGCNRLSEDIAAPFFYVHSLALEKDEDKIFSSLRSNTRRNIQKAQKDGITITIGNSFNDIKVFYKLYCLTRQRHGLPPQPFIFFRNIYDYIISKNYGIVVLGKHNDKVIAGAVFFHFGEKALFKYGASNLAFQHFRANNLILWKAIEHYCRNGYTVFSFGKTEPHNTGLLQFKRSWNPAEQTAFSYRYEILEHKLKAEKSHVKGFYNNLFRMTPIFILRIIGSAIYRFIG